jgi:DNA-binding NarL/FixJ family response regulator
VERGLQHAQAIVPTILLADADPMSAASLSNLLSPHGEVRVAPTLQGALAAVVDCVCLRAAVVAVGPPGYWCSLSLVDELKRVHPDTPAVLLGASHRPSVANAAYLLGVDYLERPVDRACIDRFMSAHLPFAARVALRTERWRDRYKMSDAQTDTLRRAARGRTGTPSPRFARPRPANRKTKRSWPIKMPRSAARVLITLKVGPPLRSADPK